MGTYGLKMNRIEFFIKKHGRGIVAIIVLFVVWFFMLPRVGNVIDIRPEDVDKIEISNEISYLDHDYSDEVWIDVTDKSDIRKLLRIMSRPIISKRYVGVEGGTKRIIVMHLENDKIMEMTIHDDVGISVNGQRYGFAFSFGGHRTVMYDDIDKVLSVYDK